jgi:two-component system, cell cycle response regulator
MRITRKVFHDLAIWMILFGLLIGVAFPFFVILLGVSSRIALTLGFFLACLGAGALAGIINFALARIIVGSRMRLLARAMTHIEENLLGIAASGDMAQCTAEDCLIEVDSDDEIGESAVAFNRLVESLEHSLETQAAVRSFSEMLTSKLELEELAEQALRQFMKHSEASGGAILSEAGGELTVAAVHGLLDAESLANNDHVRLAVRTGESQRVLIPDDVKVDGVLAQFRPAEIFILPAIYKSIPLGVVVLAAAEPLGAEAHARMELFRHSFGLALNNAIAHDRLQRLAALDPLTGTYNRRFGLGRLHEEFDRAVRMNSPLGLLMMDIDHFKVVNDTYGHLVGDRLLVAVTGVAKTILRDGDVLLRYGGEEFLAVLPAASSEDLCLVGERLRRAVEDASVADGSQTIRVTISLGAASYPNQSVEKESELVELADAALYKAKEMGRNRLVVSK